MFSFLCYDTLSSRVEAPLYLGHNYVDPTGMLDGWYKNEDNEIVYDEDINSQEDLEAAGIEGTYKGEEGVGFNPETGRQVNYFEDGSSFETPEMLAEVEVDGGKMSDHARAMRAGRKLGIYKGQNDFLRTGAKVSGYALQQTGDITALAGYGLTLTGVGAPIGVTLAAVGNGMSLTGSAIDLAYQIEARDRGGAIRNLGFMVGGAAAGAAAKGIPGSSLAKQILKQNAELKVNGIKRLIDHKSE